MELYPACMWIFALIGAMAAAWRITGDSRVLSLGATLLVTFAGAVLVTAYGVGWLLREEKPREYRTPVYLYRGPVYVRPMGRGIAMDLPGRETYLETELPEGDLYIEIVAYRVEA
jgi:hypothetical protein